MHPKCPYKAEAKGLAGHTGQATSDARESPRSPQKLEERGRDSPPEPADFRGEAGAHSPGLTSLRLGIGLGCSAVRDLLSAENTLSGGQVGEEGQ